VRAVLVEGDELLCLETQKNAGIVFGRISEKLVPADRDFIEGGDLHSGGIVRCYSLPQLPARRDRCSREKS